jgi:hypothetical protein
MSGAKSGLTAGRQSRIAPRFIQITFALRKSTGARACAKAMETTMCRNIKTLFNFEPPATHAEIHASALQFVRKLSGFNSPSQANAEAFNRAVSEVSDSARRLLASLHTHAPARDRETEAEKARERSRLRFG